MDGRYELQIGRDAWTIERSGYEMVETPVALTATIWQVDGCVAAIRFEVAPVPGRSRTTVDLGDGTRTPGIRRTGSDAVPTRSVSMHRAHAPTCALPDTATANSSPSGFDAAPVVWLIVAGSGLAASLVGMSGTGTPCRRRDRTLRGEPR